MRAFQKIKASPLLLRSVLLSGLLFVLFDLTATHRGIPSIVSENAYVQKCLFFFGMFLIVHIFLMLTQGRQRQGELSLLDEINVCIMIVGLDGAIQYVNHHGKEVFKTLSTWLPIEKDQVVGYSYYELCRNPDEQRRILQDVSNLPIKGELDIGSEILETHAIPVYNNSGRYSSAMVIWKIVTRQRNQQRWEKVVEEQIETTSAELDKASRELQTISQEVKQMAEDTSVQAEDVANFAKQVSGLIDELVEAVEQMSSKTKVIADNVKHSSQIAQQALTESQLASQIISELGDMTNRIDNMTENIGSIMEEAHVLSLNANIEAARAGAAGKGFSVIAHEVGNLSKETASVTRDITDVTNQILEKIPLSASSIKAVQEVVNQMNKITLSMGDLMGEQTVVMDDMNDHMNNAGTNTQQITVRIDEVVSHAQTTIDRVEKESRAAKNIAKIAGVFNIVVDRFKEERIVTPNDIYRMLTIIDRMIDAWLQHRVSSADLKRIWKIRPSQFQNKKPADVLQASISSAKTLLSLLNLPEEQVHFPKGTVTPTQTYNFLLRMVEIIENALVEQGFSGVDELKKADPVANKTPNDAFAVIEMAGRKLEISQQLMS